MTFRACSSPAPTPVKPQPTLAILSQESVHTTLSITHHIRKRPSTGPRTTHGPQMATTNLFRGVETDNPYRHIQTLCNTVRQEGVPDDWFKWNLIPNSLADEAMK
jgi:hypothetical protein